MRLPRKVWVCGKLWTVVEKKLLGRKLEGICIHSKRQIQIDESLPDEEKQEVFLHELLHACLPEHPRWSAKAEEHMVRRLSPRLLEALQSIRWAP